MKRFLIHLLLILFPAVALSQSSEKLSDGYHIFKYPNGAISSEGNFKNGKPDGFWKSYYVTGIIKSVGKYSNHMLDSIWMFFDQSGDTLEKISYLFGKKNGYYLKYRKDPSSGLYIWSRELFAGDKKEGVAYIYYPGNIVKQTITYNEGKKEGISKELDLEGNLISVLEYNNDFLISRERINRTDNNGMKQGVWKEFYPNGLIRTERSFRDNLLHGYYKEYDIKGNLTLTMLYENGAIVRSNVEDEPDIEIVNRYDQSGKLIYSGPFRKQVPVGVHREYSADGKVANAKLYNDNGLLLSEGIVDDAGRYNGKWKDYYATGKVFAEGQYTDSRRTGIWKFYNAAGRTEQSGSYNNGRPDGLWTWYYDTGEVLREEEYYQGVRDGLYTEYSITGEVLANGQYSDGERNSEWKFKSVNNTEEGNYILGLKDGTWKSFYQDGRLRYKGEWVQGNPDGVHVYYYENGKIREERYYDSGIRERSWKKYNEDGNLIITIAYKNDVEISINGVKIKLPESDVKLIK